MAVAARVASDWRIFTMEVAMLGMMQSNTSSLCILIAAFGGDAGGGEDR